ncbi:hypothetical protein D019_2270 [Vibrio parahaemolyticus VP2007-095]|nr:hypothetical protein D019_2270 [Vibrio parahaemolyticus VP2007-095]
MQTSTYLILSLHLCFIKYATKVLTKHLRVIRNAWHFRFAQV